MTVKMAAFWVASFLKGTGRLVVSLQALLFTSLLFCFNLPVFVSIKVFAFHQVVKFEHFFLGKKKKVSWCWEKFLMILPYIVYCKLYILYSV